MGAPISLLPVLGLPEITEGDDLAAMISARVELRRGDILVVAQKIISKAEGRVRDLADVTPGVEAKRLAEVTGKDARLVQAVLDESDRVLRAKPGVLIVRHRLGLVMANGGIDQSNLPGGETLALLLPVDPDASAAALRDRLGGQIGVIVSDSFGRAWRNGTVNVAIGSAGVRVLHDQRGQVDRDGRAMQVTLAADADALAAAAGLVMGEGREGIPAVIISGVGRLSEGRAADLVRPEAEDMFL
jgi:coenzyme F420-0:L-glutamate ligase / coenzyme F420-1:gamma-L-glutamate ligase